MSTNSNGFAQFLRWFLSSVASWLGTFALGCVSTNELSSYVVLLDKTDILHSFDLVNSTFFHLAIDPLQNANVGPCAVRLKVKRDEKGRVLSYAEILAVVFTNAVPDNSMIKQIYSFS